MTMRPLLSLLVTVVLLFQPVASLETVSANSNSATFTLYDNGSSQNGVEMEISFDQFHSYVASSNVDDITPSEAFAIEMSSHIEVSKYMAPKPVIATRAYREDGELITDFDQLLPNDSTSQNRRVYLVAEGLEFVWPFVEYGYNQTVSDKVVPPTPGTGRVFLESLSETPRVFRVYNMATEEEANAIIETALSKTGDGALRRSTVGSAKGTDGGIDAKEDRGRTSENSWDYDSPAAKKMIARSFQLTNIEEDDGKRDGLQVVRYIPGQGYNTHPDYFTTQDDSDFDFHPYSGGSNRFATVFMYLNEPEEGGNTVFPRTSDIGSLDDVPQHALDMFSPSSWERSITEDCYTKLGVPPKLGTAALFYSITPDGQIDASSHHAACPLIKGTKWGANIWIWNKQRYGDIRTGEPRTIQMKNQCDEDVYISWERVDNGVIKPGGVLQMNSYEHHRFKASFGSHKGEKIAEFTVQSEPVEGQDWIIKPPRQHGLHASTSSTNDNNDVTNSGVEVEVINDKDYKVCISWEGNEFVTLGAQMKTVLNTFENHVFAAAWPACGFKPFMEYRVRDSKKQIWRIEPDHEEL